MINQRTSSQAGFTLTELVMVMAIGGLMLAAVLIAVLTATQMRNDSNRKAAAATMQKNLQTWASNNRGIYPTDSTTRSDFVTDFGSDVIDPKTGNPYTLIWAEHTSGNNYTVREGSPAVAGRLAPGEMAIVLPAGSRSRKAVICVGTELNDFYCTANPATLTQ